MPGSFMAPRPFRTSKSFISGIPPMIFSAPPVTRSASHETPYPNTISAGPTTASRRCTAPEARSSRPSAMPVTTNVIQVIAGKKPVSRKSSTPTPEIRAIGSYESMVFTIDWLSSARRQYANCGVTTASTTAMVASVLALSRTKGRASRKNTA